MKWDEIKAQIAAEEEKLNSKKTTRHNQDKEHRIQVECVKWFRLQYNDYAGYLFAIPNGGKRDAKTGAYMKAEGVLAGVADLFLAMPKFKGENTQWHGLFIEMKTNDRSSKQSEAQQRFEASMAFMRYKYVICRSFNDFKQTIDEYLCKTTETSTE